MAYSLFYRLYACSGRLFFVHNFCFFFHEYERFSTPFNRLPPTDCSRLTTHFIRRVRAFPGCLFVYYYYFFPSSTILRYTYIYICIYLYLHIRYSLFNDRPGVYSIWIFHAHSYAVGMCLWMICPRGTHARICVYVCDRCVQGDTVLTKRAPPIPSTARFVVLGFYDHFFYFLINSDQKIIKQILPSALAFKTYVV